LNVPERDRFERSIRGVLSGVVDLERLMHDRFRSAKPEPAKVKVESRIDSSNDFSPHSTVLEVISQDRPGLLHDLTSVVAEHRCNIEVALIDTEGQVAIDVLYLTYEGNKLRPERQNLLVKALLDELNRN
jgi:[protein-PII] uridylyltransferase